METNFKPLLPYYSNFFGSQNLGLLILSFITAVFLIVKLRKKKTSDRIQNVSLLSFLPFGLRGIAGVNKIPIFELFRKMGPLLSVPSYSAPVIVVSSDYEVIKQMLNSPDEWIDRPLNPLLAIRANGNQERGILSSSGPVWKETRRYAIKTLTQLGLGKRGNLVCTTNEELQGLLQDMENIIHQTNNNVPMRGFFSLPTINVIWRIVGGKRFTSTDPQFIEIVGAVDAITETSFYSFLLGDILSYSAILKAPALFGLTKLVQAQNTMNKHFTSIVDKSQDALRHKNEITEDETFTDHFLRKMNFCQNSSNNNNVENKVFSLDNVLVTLFDLFGAGVDTTSSTLEFAVMFLVTHPEVQTKMRNEIKSVIGDKEPSFYTDRNLMPYTQAVISEVHRMASIIPLNLRSATRDCSVNGVPIKKGTMAVINQYSIHYDEKFWVDPHNFRPERFLNNEGELDSAKLGRLLNFGSGKRVCIGESVASISIFTLLVGVLQVFELRKANPNEECGMEIMSSFTSRTKPFHVHFARL